MPEAPPPSPPLPSNPRVPPTGPGGVACSGGGAGAEPQGRRLGASMRVYLLEMLFIRVFIAEDLFLY